MATNGTSIAAESGFGEAKFGDEGFRNQARKRAPDARFSDSGYSSAVAGDPADTRDAADDFALAPLVDKIAFGIASGLVVAVKELEQHIATETRKVGDAVERQIDTLQTSLQELFRFVEEQRSANVAVQDQLRQLAVADAGLTEAHARHAADLSALRTQANEFSASALQRFEASAVSLRDLDSRHSTQLEALRTESSAFASAVSKRIGDAVAALEESDAKQATHSKSISERLAGVCGDIGVQQEDMVAVKATLGTVCARIDSLVERLDRQAEAVRLMHTNYSQRETELEQLVNGLARLRAFPTPLPTNGL